MRQPRNDPHGYRTCTRCLIQFEATRLYFHLNSRVKDKCANRCKRCSNKERTERFIQKKSHNIQMRCHKCDVFYWASLAELRKRKRRNINANFYCSSECSFHAAFSFSGQSWNGARRGSNNPNAIINEDIARLIKLRLKEGCRNKAISLELGVNRHTISAIKAGRLWRHILI